MTLRNADIEAIRNKAKLDGRPMKSTTVIDKNGNRVDFRVNRSGNPEIVHVQPTYREDRA